MKLCFSLLGGNICLVFEYMDTDLEMIIREKEGIPVLRPSDIKQFLLQTLLGLEYLHAHWILHRVSPSASLL